jgi:D-tyrosyl-tRNA(Tyr) deacylase
MIAVIQRVSQARVEVARQTVGQIGPGLVVLAAVHATDTAEDVAWTARKIVELRVFRSEDAARHFERDIRQVGGAVLLVSNFTVAAATRRGRRPSFDAAANAAVGQPLFEQLVAAVRQTGIHVETGSFGADMLVSLANDGPATFVIDSRSQGQSPDRPEGQSPGPDLS